MTDRRWGHTLLISFHKEKLLSSRSVLQAMFGLKNTHENWRELMSEWKGSPQALYKNKHRGLFWNMVEV